MSSFNALLSKLHRDTPQRSIGTLLPSDNAGEFLSTEFTEFLAASAVHNTTCPPHHVHQLNGVAE
eukprot:6199796-Pleurochrysis_carterae.AAC.3